LIGGLVDAASAGTAADEKAAQPTAKAAVRLSGIEFMASSKIGAGLRESSAPKPLNPPKQSKALRLSYASAGMTRAASGQIDNCDLATGTSREETYPQNFSSYLLYEFGSGLCSSAVICEASRLGKLLAAPAQSATPSIDPLLSIPSR
jgi:hypothetical protein